MTKTSKFKVGDRVIANDNFGNYSNVPAIVVGFSKNFFKKPLVRVKLQSSGVTTAFYESELAPDTRLDPIMQEIAEIISLRRNIPLKTVVGQIQGLDADELYCLYIGPAIDKLEYAIFC
jgi:hypothetical protein